MTWTRLLALRLGHTTAAAATVVSAFMGGLALGALGAGIVAPRLNARRALHLYALAEALVVLSAVTLPWQIHLLTPLLRAAYGEAPGPAFAAVRVAACIGLLLVPTTALGASFPLAARARELMGGSAGALYAANTCGAAIGAAAAGFLLLPALGISRTLGVGVAMTTVATVLALFVARHEGAAGSAPQSGIPATRPTRGRRARTASPSRTPHERDPVWLPPVVAAFTGVAGFVLEIAWTRVFALVAGPSAYAFSATLVCFIGGLALGSVAGAALARARGREGAALACTLGASALVAYVTAGLAGTTLPAWIAVDFAASTDGYLTALVRHVVWIGALMVPVAASLGCTFPLLLRMAARQPGRITAEARVYGLNTLGSVAGALATGFILLPTLGLEATLDAAVVVLAVAATVTALATQPTLAWRVLPPAIAVAALVAVPMRAPWNRMLLVSGAYKYGRYIEASDVQAVLTAGTLRYYRDGAASTVAVRDLTGTRSLSIDGKVDASSDSDMATQKLLAHVPLLLHANPARVLVIGLGSGVTAGAALTHPVRAVDVVELSPEVVESSVHFVRENRHALEDPRTRVIVGDGRSHLMLSRAAYDVIVSEPSNPWMAGVAALFTREFFELARARLAPGGILCQWAHTYDISTEDLRSIAATFTSVFPQGTMWVVGEGDLLMVGASEPLVPALSALATNWARPGVADDLASVGVVEPFGLVSMLAGGPAQIARLAAGGTIQRDDRMALEYTGPRALNGSSREANTSLVAALQHQVRQRTEVAQLMQQAGAAEWRRRGTMMLRTRAFNAAYEDFDRALALSAGDVEAADGLARVAVAAGREQHAVGRLQQLADRHPSEPAPRVALARLLAATGRTEEAIRAAIDACRMTPPSVAALEQLAAIYADAGDADGLSAAVAELVRLFPDSRATAYYEGALAFLRGDLPSARGRAERAIARGDAGAPAHNLLGAIYATGGDPVRARESFARAVSLDPRDVSAYTNLATLEASQGHTDTARALFAEALTLDPRLDAARAGLARARPR